jgi:hypothetical protein
VSTISINKNELFINTLGVTGMPMAGDYTTAKIVSELSVRAPLMFGPVFHLDIGLESVNNEWTRQPLIFVSVCVYLKHKLA